MQTEKFICDWKSKLYDAYAWQEVNKIPKCSLLHDIINPPERAKILNGPYSPILHGCMNNIKGKEKFKKFRIILDNGSSSAIVMGRLVGKIDINRLRTKFKNFWTHHRRWWRTF